MIDIKLFGKFEIQDASGAPITVCGSKTQGLIAFLAMTVELPPTRDRLVNLFWGDRFSDQARQSLRQAIAKLRRVLPSEDQDLFIVDQDRVGFNPEAVRVDVERFGRLAASDVADEVFEAVSLLRGPLLDGFFGQQPAFEDWIASERQRLNEMAAKVLERAATAAQKRGDMETALAHARHLTEVDPWSDTAQMVLLRLLAQNGNRAAAIQAFTAYEETLRGELGISAGQELCDLVDQIRSDGIAPSTAPVDAIVATAAVEPARRTSLAFVPFACTANAPAQNFLVDGLTDDLTAKIARFGWLDIHAGSSAQGGRLTAPEMSTLYAGQGVDYVVHGSLRSQGPRHRLTVQVADPGTGRYLWVERFDRDEDDAFALQDELSDSVVGALECALERLEGRNVRDKALDEMNAWECYHRGLALLTDFDGAKNQEAQRCFRKAIELDPNFALAYARLAHGLVMSAIYHEAHGVEAVLDEAAGLAHIAAKLDPEDAFVRFALARVLMCQNGYEDAIHNFRKAIVLNPNLASSYCGIADSMAYSGDVDAAMPYFERALSVCADDIERWTLLKFGAMAMMFRGDYDTSETWAARAQAVPNATYWPTAIRAASLAHRGRMDEARDAVARLLKLRPGITCDFVSKRLFYLRDKSQIDTYVGGLHKAGLA